jgi:hypothetical protein
MATGRRNYVIIALASGLALGLGAWPLSMTSIKWEKAPFLLRVLCRPVVYYSAFCLKSAAAAIVAVADAVAVAAAVRIVAVADAVAVAFFS